MTAPPTHPHRPKPAKQSAHHTPPADPPIVSTAMAQAYQRYWRFNLALIAVLLTIGGGVSFAIPFAAGTLNAFHLAGFRLPFYFGAQGAILIYLALIVVYIVLIQRAGRNLRQATDAQSNPTNDT